MALLVAAPAASALPKPALYFLHDAPLPTLPAPAPGLPATGNLVAEGQLTTVPPPGLPPVNTADPTQLPATAEGAKAPQTRMILPGEDMVVPVQFVTSNTTANTGRIFGPVVTLLFLPNTPLVQNGNLTVQLVALPKDASPTDLPPKGDVLASGRIRLDYQNSSLPPPTALVPPNPNDPQAALGYVQAQLLAYGLTQLASSYKVAFLLNDTRGYIVDKAVDPASKVALRLVLEPGSSPLPIAFGAGQPLLYNSTLTPSFVYVPWYAADPPRPVPTYTAPSPHSASPYLSSTSHAMPTYGYTGGDSSSTGGKKKSPGIEVPLVAVGLGLLVAAVRRRLS
jgi:hypothetical protein